MNLFKKSLILGLCFILGVGLLGGCSGTNATADKNLGKDPETMAVALVTDLSRGEYQKAIDNFDYTVEMKKALNKAAYEEIWTQLQTQNGLFIKINGTKIVENGDYLSVRIQSAFEKSNIDLQVTFDGNNIISGFHILEYSGDTASTVVPDNIKEESITFGEDAFLLSGTLTTPTQGENFPCVILVQGLGPQDRNETLGPNAPFRDIAWGLAQQGIASIRYDKRTKTYGDHMGENFTPREETIDDVIHALAYAQKMSQINGNSLFILGHGFGGYLMPKIAEQTPDAAGYIILGGSTSPLEDLMIRQYDYLASLDNTITNDEAEFMSQAKTSWNEVKQLTPDSNETSSQLMGIAKDYWLYLKDYNPIVIMKSVEKPVIILQGEGDYETDMTEFGHWKSALADKTNVTLKSYPGLNHLFIMGNGSKSPEEYEIPGKVSQEVINDLASFIQVNSNAV